MSRTILSRLGPLAALHMLAIAGYASNIATLTSTGCADSKGMDTCAAAASTVSSECIAAANGDSVVIEGCGCAWYVANINCYASHCWNRAYECEYQEYVTQYFQLCLIAKLPLPYFPAPNGVPDSCSCNIGNVLNGIDGSIEEIETCQQTQSGVVGLNGVIEADAECQCCGLSGAVSSIYNFCPKTDPSLALSAVSTFELTFGRSFASCASTLSQINCSSGLGFNATSVGGTFFTPDDLPPNGTATVTNLPGKVTAPASGTVFTYTNLADQQVYTISAVNAPKGGSSGGGGGSGGGGSGGPTGIPQRSSARKALSLLGEIEFTSLVAGSTVILLSIVSCL